MAERTVLVVEDEAAIRMGIVDNLALEGYRVLEAADAATGQRLALDRDPDCIILDLMLPDGDGLDVCKRLRRERIRGAILILTAKGASGDRVKGLDYGADDYLAKPFEVKELLARVRALLRRVEQPEEGVQEIQLGDLHLNFQNFAATKGDKPLKLTTREFKILKLFVDNPGRVISRGEFLDKVWGYDIPPNTRTVDNHIARLRKRVEEDSAHPRFILSVRGIGYKFQPPA